MLVCNNVGSSILVESEYFPLNSDLSDAERNGSGLNASGDAFRSASQDSTSESLIRGRV